MRYVSWSCFLKVLKATLQNYGRLYILDVRALTWGTRCFPDYSLYIVFFIFFVMDELKSAHLFILADFYFIVIFSWRLSSFFLEIIVVETLPFNTPSTTRVINSDITGCRLVISELIVEAARRCALTSISRATFGCSLPKTWFPSLVRREPVL